MKKGMNKRILIPIVVAMMMRSVCTVYAEEPGNIEMHCGCTNREVCIYSEPSFDSAIVNKFEYNWMVYYEFENRDWLRVELPIVTYDDYGNCNIDITRGYLPVEHVALDCDGLPYNESLASNDVG